MGFPVYRRLGFQKLCAMEHYYWSAPAASASAQALAGSQPAP
jgi:hypothetical protein